MILIKTVWYARACNLHVDPHLPAVASTERNQDALACNDRCKDHLEGGRGLKTPGLGKASAHSKCENSMTSSASSTSWGLEVTYARLCTNNACAAGQCGHCRSTTNAHLDHRRSTFTLCSFCSSSWSIPVTDCNATSENRQAPSDLSIADYSCELLRAQQVYFATLYPAYMR